jgi:hypothetical protein
METSDGVIDPDYCSLKTGSFEIKYDYGTTQLRKLPDTGPARQEPEIAHRAVLEVAYRVLSGLAEIFRLAERGAARVFATTIQPEMTPYFTLRPRRGKVSIRSDSGIETRRLILTKIDYLCA